MRGCAIAVVLALTASAAAEPAPGDRLDGTGDAGALFVRGRELKTAGRLAEACELFDRSYQLDPAPGTGLNLADCFELRGQLRRAWELFDRVARDPANGASRVQLARKRAEALTAKLATVIVTLHDPRAAGLTIQLGDRALVPAPEIRVVVEPGDVELVATRPGQPAFTAALRAVAGATVAVDVPALRAPAPGGRRRLGYLTGGLAAAGTIGLGVSLGFALAAVSANHDAFRHGCAQAPAGVVCTGADGPRLIHLAGTRADLATGFAIGGAALVGAAAVVLVTAPRDTVRVAPITGDGALGLGMVGRF